MPGETLDSFAFGPLRSRDLVGLQRNILDQHGRSGRANPPDLASVDGHATKLAIEEGPVLSGRVHWGPSAGGQLKAFGAILAPGAREAGGADVCGQEQPDPRQGDAGL